MSEADMTSENKLPALKEKIAGELQSPELPVFAASLIHEVKNPLAAIHLHLQLLEGYVSEIEQEEVREKVQNKVALVKKEIIGLNRTMVELIRLIRPQTPAQQDALDINTVIKDVIDLLEIQALREGIDLIFRPGKTEGAENIDPVFIKQIVMNLVLNSIEAFKNSSIDPEKRKLEILTGIENDMLFIRIADNGPGMSAEIQNRIFEPFFSTKKEGSGLGLALVKRMVGEMDGKIEVHSVPGSGTEFVIYLRKIKLISAGA